MLVYFTGFLHRMVLGEHLWPHRINWVSMRGDNVKRLTILLLLAGLAIPFCLLRVDAGEVIVSEFMAVNNSTLADVDGDYSDWIELHNRAATNVDLAGWYLTDSTNNLTEWRFPGVTLEAGGFLLVFASGKDRTNATEELHTDFKLSGGGEYLALVNADGITVEHEYSPAYPEQIGDTSFGATYDDTRLIAEGASCRWLVPTSDSLGTGWTARVGFDDSVWDSGLAALGYDLGEAYTSHIFTDVSNRMYGVNESVYLRVPFSLESTAELASLTLNMKYDDGFVAYINGQQVASTNAPGSPEWDSAAAAVHADPDAVEWNPFAVAEPEGILVEGENVLAVHGLNYVPHDPEPDFLLVPELAVSRRVLSYLSAPTPGTTNSEGVLLSDVVFTPQRGFYASAFELTIATDAVGGEIRYTTDFSEPTTNSTLYTGVIAVSNTTVLRAAAFQAGYRPSRSVTHTYIFLDDVINQPDSPPGFPTTWGGTTADYDMNQGTVAGYGLQEMTNALLFIPSVSIVTDMDSLFDPTVGIYANPNGHGLAWERAASVEWINPDSTTGFDINCGLRIQGGLGGGGRNYKKKSFRLVFKGIYGPTKLDFPMFDWDPDAVTRFDSITFRGGANDRQDYTRDEFSRRCQLAMGRASAHGVHVHLYVNGLYWGLYNPVERPAGDFGASYFGGGSKDNWDAVAHNANNVVDGDNQAWNAMIAQGRAGLADNAAYQMIQGNNPDGTRNPAYPHYLDVPNHLDYMLCNIYLGMGDWPGHNWYAARQRDEESTGYKFFIWDGEGSFSTRDVTGVNGGAAEPYGDLRANEEFNVLFGDHVYRHLFNDGALTPEKAIPRFSDLSDSMEWGIAAENARWGHISLSSWRNRRDDKLNNYLPNRTAGALVQLRNAGLYPSIDVPVLSHEAGVFSNAFDLTMSASNDIYYTLDSSDPREYGTGDPAGDLYAGPVHVSYSVLVKVRARSASGEWSALNEALFILDAESPLRVTEVMAHPRYPRGAETNAAVTAEDFEFIELLNTGTGIVGLTGMQFSDGIDFDFTGSAVYALAPGESTVVVRNRDAFTNRYPGAAGMAIAGEYEGFLDNDGETVTLKDGSGRKLLSFTYNDSRGWPTAAGGAGHSLVPLVLDDQLNGALEYGGNWRASTFLDGSPFAVDPVSVTNVIIREIMAHTDYASPEKPEYDSNDWLELFNPSESPVSLGDWYLSDDATNLMKWAIPATNTVAALGRLVFDEVTGFHSPITNGFGLNKDGEQVFLSYLPGTSEDRVADCVRFKGQDRDRSLGRHGAGGEWWYSLSPSRDGSNPQPTQQVVISEIMYHPAPTFDHPENNFHDEYVEIHNVSGSAVDLWTDAGPWRLGGGATYVFPSNTTLAADAYMVLVPFDPTNAVEVSTFLTAYGLTNGEVQLLGPYSGNLDNRGERTALEWPQDPDEPGDPVSWVIVDEVIYFDQAPWPPEADATGFPLQRRPGWGSGNDPNNWEAGFAPSPGLQLPEIVISSPAYGATILQPSQAVAVASVDDDSVSGSVQRVEFFLDGTPVHVDTNKPYECTLETMTGEGFHALSATFTDDAGTTASREVLVILSTVNNAEGASDIAAASAALNGSLSYNGRGDATVYWGLTDGHADTNDWENATSLETQTGHFSTTVEGLRASAVYYYRCYVTNAYGHYWADSTASFVSAPANVSLDLSVATFSENGGTATVTALLGNSSESNVTVNLAFVGDALYGLDYTASATTIVINAGSTSGSITLTGLDDGSLEDPEQVTVGIASTVNASKVLPYSVTAEVISDDPRVVNGAAAAIGESYATLSGELTHGDSAVITIYWGRSDGGTNALNWEGSSDLGTKNEGPFTVQVSGLMANQTYFYRCYASTDGGMDWADSATSFTTLAPSVAILDVTVTEGNSGTANAAFLVELSTTSGTNVSVDYATADGSALAGSDYVAGSGTLIITAGQPNGQINVTVKGDAESEWPGESFFVNLDNAVDCTIADDQGVGTIADDDVAVYLHDWLYRMKMTFSGYDKEETLTDFPALIVFKPDLVNFEYEQLASGSGGDLRFANSNLTALLDYEIEEWNTNGDSYVWVRVPQLSNTNTEVWAYWGNADDTVPLPSVTNGATWAADHVGVWHMTEPNVVDSAGDNDGSEAGNVTSDGFVGDAQYFDDDYIEISNEPNFDFDDALTVSCWMRITNGWRTSWQAFVSKEGENNRGWQLRRSSGNDYATFTVRGTSASDDPGSSSNIGDGEWHYLTGVFGGGKRYTYIDGLQEDERDDSGNIANSDEPIRIGARQSANARHRGWIDEVRIIHGTRSTNWVWATWFNMAHNSDFITYGPTLAADVNAPSIFVVYGATNITDSSAYLTARLTSTGAAETVVSAYWGTEDGGINPTNWAHSFDFGPVSQPPDIDHSAVVTGLLANTEYSYAYRAANSYGTNWASSSFWSEGPPAVASTGGAESGIGVATLHGRLTNESSADVTIFWGTDDGGTNGTAWAHSVALGQTDGNRPFSTELTGLLYGLQYYYRAYATNAYGDDWAESTVPFLTLTPHKPAEPGLLVRLYDSIHGDDYIDPISVIQNTPEDGTTNQIADIDYDSFANVFYEITSDDSLTILWEGIFVADEDATYTFGTRSDDGSVLCLDLNGDGDLDDKEDGEQVVENKGYHGAVERTGQVTLSAGRYPIATAVFEGGGGQSMEARWGKGSGLAYSALDFIDGTSGLFLRSVPGTPIGVINTDATGITHGSAILNATLLASGTVFHVSTHWGNENRGTNDTWDHSAFIGSYTNLASVSLQYPVTDLLPETTYYYTFRATNAGTDAWAAAATNFTTLVNTGPAPPRIDHSVGVADVTTTSAWLRATLTTAGSELTEVWCHWGDNDAGTNLTWDHTVYFGTNTATPPVIFSNLVADLAPDTSYYYRYQAVNAVGDDWGDQTASFDTDSPAISISDAVVAEGNQGTTVAVFSVTLHAPGTTNVSVDYYTVEGTAEAGSDYVATNGVLHFGVGQTTAEVRVTVTGDTRNELPSEEFHVDLSDPVNARIEDSRGTCTILDEDLTTEGWPFKTRIAFGWYDGTEVLTNFPVLVILGSHISGFSYAQFESEIAGDLRFISSTGTEMLNFEIESWDTNGQSFVWVQLPELVATNTSIWACWGNADATIPPASTTNGSTWSEGYVGVYHLNETGTAQRSDASPLGNHGTTQEYEGDEGAAGKIAGADSFDGGNDAVMISDHASLDMTDAITLSAWFKANSWAFDNVLIRKDGDYRFYNRETDMTLKLPGVGGETVLSPISNFDTGQWYYVAGTYDRHGGTSNMVLYVNGARADARTETAQLHTSGDNVYIGRKSNGTQTFDGILDEARISNVSRSADWIEACWMNQASNNTFQSYGTVSIDPDADGDDISDAWEIMYFLTTSVTDGGVGEDWDGDGVSDRGEYISGTDPTNPLSLFVLELTWTSGVATVTFPAIETTAEYGATERYYSLDRTTGILFNAWQGIDNLTNIHGTGQTVIYSTPPGANTPLFFRGKAWLSPE